ncbi:MAG: hypothetical protein HYZ81_20780, partial [Nitrospinae bacterium]|nr:hypothetical protein [Nitrospinota bacterium]
ATGTLIGTGVPFRFPDNIAVEAAGGLVVTDSALKAVVRVDPATGARTLVSGIDPATGAVIGSGPPFLFPRGMAIEAAGTLVVADVGLPTLVRVDPMGGVRSLVSVVSTSSAPAGIAIEAAGSLVVMDTGLRAVVRVDPSSGRATIVSDGSTGSGLPFIFPVGIAVEADGSLVVTDTGLRAVVRIHPVSGARNVVSGIDFGAGPLIGSGPPFGFLAGIAVEATSTLVVTDIDPGSVVRVDPLSGTRSLVSAASIGGGPPLDNPVGIAIEAAGSLVVADASRQAVLRIHQVSGTRSVVSGRDPATGALIGSGPPFGFPFGIAVEAAGTLVVTEPGRAVVVRVDPVSGARRVVSGLDPASGALIGSGPAFGILTGIAVEAAGSLVVADVGLQAVVRVDHIHGTRTILSRIIPR